MVLQNVIGVTMIEVSMNCNSILAEPPSMCDTDIDDLIQHSHDNQSNDDFPSEYCDDFEEYESDFEEEDEEDNEDNDRNSKQHTQHISDEEEEKVDSPLQDEVELKRNEVMNRSKELLEIIKLDKILFTNFDLPPINYDMFIKTFGRKDAKQVSCQTIDREDNETQTDSLEICTKWTQNPSATRLVAGNESQLNDKLSSNSYPIPKSEKVLICRSHIMSAFAEQYLVVGAMIDGSLALWDLNEVSNSFKEIIIDNQMFVLRTPSYNSALTATEHNCPVVAIKKLSYSESNDESIHFLTVDENGILVIWAIHDIKGVDLDIKSLKITTLECQPNDWSNFYCGTDNGLVIRHTRQQELITKLPKVYQKSQMNSLWTKVAIINNECMERT
ncbi:unnamed protein product [Medioppia subpectinata]|uniref:WD repeat-containing protein 60 n=1 Tax=Medioppia subpectinata TaxID=1979941 RepID=A0A7R9KUY2_9ACAR|nr:unnamed protein product [Medioppia subpectinata]CAG2110348.1 unnamed protein product [Medioppia subpectinata]